MEVVKKEGGKKEGDKKEYITVVVGDVEIRIRVPMSTQMREIKRNYCERYGVPMEGLRFRFDGRPFKDEDTPKILEMVDGDTIDVFQPQEGGSHSH